MLQRTLRARVKGQGERWTSLPHSRSRSHAKMTGVTTRMWSRLLSIPPMTGAASGFITSEPVRVLHMMGSRLATMVEYLNSRTVVCGIDDLVGNPPRRVRIRGKKDGRIIFYTDSKSGKPRARSLGFSHGWHAYLAIPAYGYLETMSHASFCRIARCSSVNPSPSFPRNGIPSGDIR